MAHVIQVIETEEKRGRGTDDDIVRLVKQFWSLDGQLLMEHDPFPSGKVPKPEVCPDCGGFQGHHKDCKLYECDHGRSSFAGSRYTDTDGIHCADCRKLLLKT